MPNRYSDQEPLYGCVVAREGTTTLAGTAAGDNFVDAGLAGAGANSFISMLAVLYPGDPQNVDSKDITAFDNVAGRVTLAGPYKGVAAAIPAGVPYKIVTFRFVPAEVAALLADIGDASASVLGSLYAILGDPSTSLTSKINHVPKFTGDLWWVSTTGDDADDGKSPEMAFLTIAHAITTAAAGDRIYVKAGAYDEALVMNKAGLELVCEQGTILVNTAPGTPLVVGPADYQRVVGAILAQAGQTGLQVTGDFCSIEDCLAFGSSVGFDDDGLETHFINCRSISHTTTGFDISAGYGQYEKCIAAGGAAAVTGILLSDAAADHNHFFNCHTLGNATRGWDVIANADNNMFSHCSTGAGDGAKRDLGTNNTWDEFSEGSQIVAGQTRDQDLKDILDAIGGASQRYKEQIPDTDVSLLAIDNDLAANPPDADAENSVVDIDINAGDTFVLRSLWVNISTFGTDATKLTFALWVTLKDAAVTKVDEVDVESTGIQSLMDLFGLPEVHADGIWITVVSNGATADAQLTGSYRWAKAT